MKMIRKLAISLALVLLMTPLISAQDLSRYRKFALGTSLAALSKQIGQDPHQATVIHQNPAVIQELKYWPVETSYSACRRNRFRRFYSASTTGSSTASQLHMIRAP